MLEVHWETSLAEAEYSHGAMLRSFFRRLPQVEVRHRFFHDRADFVRFCGELDELVEPIVLFVSSHGSPQGLGAGGGSIVGACIGQALARVENRELLHLGGCETLAGELGAQIRAAHPTNARFPISGVEVPADGADSALVDLTYLDLVLEQRMSPVDAVRAVRSMLTFAGSEAHEGDPIPSTDLSVLGASQ